jgi:hypothetical protein
LSKQITVLSNLDKTMNSVLRAQNSSIAALKDMNSKQNNISRQNEQMSKSINNLASSVTRSMGGMASAIGRGAGGAASAAGSAGGAIAGAASSVASGVASAVAKVLPFAIAGVVGKMMVWDNLEDSTKKEMADSFGNLMRGIFGDLDTSEFGKSLKPITKELGLMVGALGDTLDGLSKKVSDMVSILSKSIGGLTGIHKPGGAEEAFDKAKQNAKVLSTTGGKISGDVVSVAKSIGSIDSSDIGTAAIATGTATAVVGAGVLAAGAKAKPQAPAAPAPQPTTSPQQKMKTAKKPRNLSPDQIAKMQQAMASLQKKGVKKPSILHLIEELAQMQIFARGGDTLKRFFEFAAKYKLSTVGNVVQIVFIMGLGYLIYNEVESLYENGIIDEDEKSEILSYLAKKESFIATGGIIGGTLSGIGATAAGAPVIAATGGVATPAVVTAGVVAVTAGSYGGSKAGEYLADKFLTAPGVLTKEYTPVEFAGKNLYEPVGSVRSADDPRRFDRKRKGGTGKPQGAMSPSPAGSSSEMFERFKGAIGGAESQGDYGARNKSGSSASGKYQVIKSTFEQFAKDRNSPVYGMTWDQYQKSGPEVQEALMDYMLQYYNQVLIAGKVPVNEQTLYLAHFLGPETAVKVYHSDPNDPLSKYITKNGLYDLMVKQNPGLVTPGTTTGGIQLALGKRVSSQMAANKGATPSVGSTFATAEPSAPTPGLSFAQNLERRRRESQAEEEQQARNTEGSGSFVGPSMPAASKIGLSDLFSTSSIGADTFFNNFEDIVRGIEDKLSTQPPVSVVYQDNSVSNAVSGGGGGSSPTISAGSVVSRPYDKSWQFNSLAGGNPAS